MAWLLVPFVVVWSISKTPDLLEYSFKTFSRVYRDPKKRTNIQWASVFWADVIKALVISKNKQKTTPGATAGQQETEA